MYEAIIIDSNYGSVSIENQKYIQKEYAKNGISLKLENYSTTEEILNNCKNTDVILATGNPAITKDILKNLPKLKIIQRFGIGTNSIDLDSASEEGILVLYMPGFCIDELALHATALILNLLRNISYYDRGIRKGEWRKAKGPLPKNPKDLVLGLYGFGGSAKSLYNIFYNGFNSKIITCDPYIDEEIKTKYDIDIVSFEELLKYSDIISIHAPLTSETNHIFNKDAFSKMKKNAMIINISRGELIDQNALIEALDNNTIQFAGLDVFEKEPLPLDSPLIYDENTILTCHSGFYGENAQQNQIKLSIELVNSALNLLSISKKYIANKNVHSKINNLKINN